MPEPTFFQRFFFHTSQPLGPLLSLLYSAAIVVVAFLPLIGVIGVIAIWGERKVAGHIQSRIGPNRVGPFGLLQSFADGLKLLLKEDLVPPSGDRPLFRIAPYLAFVPVFVAFMALPFAPDMTFQPNLNSGLFLVLAMLSVEVMGVILGGWASNNKWSVYGAMREACQMVSYEIPLGLSLIVGVMAIGTLNLVQMGQAQGGGLHTWLVFQNPFIFLAFFIYFIASLASNKRAPFDLPESESELVAGFMTEYSGMRWAFFMFAEYAAMFIVGGVQTALFLGGWNDPLGLIGYYYHQFMQAPDQHMLGIAMLNVLGALVFTTKVSIIILIQMWLRWTLPRPRIDQVLYACVKVLLPLACVVLLGAALWQLFVPARGGVPWVNYNPFSWNDLTSDEGSPLGVVVQVLLTLGGVGLAVAIGGWIGYAAYTGWTLKKRLTDPAEIVTEQPAVTEG
jgi:NADH-quinone oxidoreductase subunit H